MYETLKMDKIKAQEIIKYMQKKDMTPQETVATMHPATSNLVWCFGFGSNRIHVRQLYFLFSGMVHF